MLIHSFINKKTKYMMQIISTALNKPLNKPYRNAALNLVCISLLLTAQTAHADFRKALDAYIARDGTTMLKEVKDAVDKNNDDDGLMLLLMATNMDAATSDYDETTKQSKSTLRAILPPPKWNEMRELLVQATNNSTVDAQYYLIAHSQFKAGLNTKTTTDYVAKSSQLAMLQSTITNKAEAGDLDAQLALGFRHLNYENEFGCEKQSKEPICQTKDDAKGYYWLKRAVKTYETSGNADYDLLPSVMCEFHRKTANGDQAKLKQAYLWALKGLNERAIATSYSMSCLHHMSDSQELKTIAPKLYGKEYGGSEFNSIVYQAELNELPDLVLEVRKDITKAELPVFSYYIRQGLDVYADGRVLFGCTDCSKSLLVKVKPKVVKAFLTDIKKAGVFEWTTKNSSTGSCSDRQCQTSDMKVTFRDGNKVKRLFFSILPEYLLQGEQASSNRNRMAIVRTVTNKYFPTQSLRCTLGNSEQRKQECLEVDIQSAKIAKAEKRNGDY